MTPLLYAVVAALATVLGGWLVTRFLPPGHRAATALLAFGAGFMLALALLGTMPVVFRTDGRAALFVVAGYLAVHLAEQVVPVHRHGAGATRHLTRSAGLAALLGLGLHAFFDGVVIASGFEASTRLGLLMFVAVLLHKLPDGASVAGVVLAVGESRARALGAAAVLGLATVLGVVLTDQALALERHGLALSAGVTLYVAATNLVPEVHHRREPLDAIAFLAGFGAFALAERLLALAAAG